MENKLTFLPLFYDDLEKTVDYIANVLYDPWAAQRLADDIQIAILKRLPYADSFEKYNTLFDRAVPYYHIRVRNYLIFYVVICDEYGNKVMEVRRLIYSKSDWEDEGYAF